MVASGVERPAWSFSANAPLDPSLRIYVPSDDNLLAIRASTGEVAWTFHASGPVQPPTVVDGIAYVVVGVLPSYDSAVVYALNASDGSQRWHAQVNGHIVQCTPAIGEGVVYVTSTSSVEALNADDGSQRWQVALSSSSSNPSSPTLANGLLFFGAGMALQWGAAVLFVPLCVARQRWGSCLDAFDW